MRATIHRVGLQRLGAATAVASLLLLCALTEEGVLIVARRRPGEREGGVAVGKAAVVAILVAMVAVASAHASTSAVFTTLTAGS